MPNKKYNCICQVCSKEFMAGVKTVKFCSELCAKIALSRLVFPDDADPNMFVECKICGYRGKELLNHIRAYHCSVDEYCQKFNCSRANLLSNKTHATRSAAIVCANAAGKCGWVKGGKNPAQSTEAKSGRNSIWSKNYRGYDGMTDEEKKAIIAEHGKNAQNTRNAHHMNKLRIDYYTTRGATEEEAQKLLAERQHTFSLKKCIERYGEMKGTEIFNARQKKWQNTLNSKSPEEKARINKTKATSIANLVGYSMISQELFNKIYEYVKDEFKDIYYATLKKPDNPFSVNHEYKILLEDGIHSYFLDFYVADNNKAIEFDGDYWHNDKRGNKEHDEQREAHLKELGYVNILHIKECNYKADPDAVVTKCVEYLRKNNGD